MKLYSAMRLPHKALLYGDNLDWLREFPSEAVDLIYLDPPFNSNADYNVIFKEHKSGKLPQAQITAFEDTWQWSGESARSLDALITAHGELGELLDLLVRKLGHNALSAYLVMMAIRLVEMHRVLKDTGSLYLHCDPTASHYLKMILDMVFGAQNFRNEIIWKRTTAKSLMTRRLPSDHDTILCYQKTEDATWNENAIYRPYDLDNLDPKTASKYSQRDSDGRLYQLTDLTNPNRNRPNLTYEFLGVTRVWRWTKERMQAAYEAGRVIQPRPGAVPRFKRYLDEQRGKPLDDVWDDIFPLNSQAAERLGYPTQKPVALLERIIRMSSNPGDIVLDPFCGCGTAIVAAEKLGRRWIGIDITHLAVALMKARLRRDFELEPGKDYTVEGMPESAESAQYLFDSDPFQFQFWAVGLIGAQPYGASAGSKSTGFPSVKGKKGGDTGIDGQLYFRTPGGEKLERVIVSVKGGKSLNPAMVRDLRGVVEREKAALGILICMHEPTKGMKEEAAIAGLYSYGGRSVPKIQILTVSELLDGKAPQLPEGALNVSLEAKTVKTAESEKPGQVSLFGSS